MTFFIAKKKIKKMKIIIRSTIKGIILSKNTKYKKILMTFFIAKQKQKKMIW